MESKKVIAIQRKSFAQMERWSKKEGYVKEETNQVNSAKICKPFPCPNRNLVIFPSGLQRFSRNLFTILHE